MQYLLFGMAALVIGLIALRAFTQANTQALARQMRLGGAIAAGAVALGLVLRGSPGYAMPLAMLALWLMAGPGGGRGMFPPWGQGGGRQTSRVTTDHLEVELEHDSGSVTGRVLKGVFAGRAIERLKPAELALLWQDCRFNDPPSAQIVEAYLDRMHPTWREDMARGEAEMSSGPDGRMTREEAAEILGVTPDADEDVIRRAHRDLMKKLHPDRGGSTYLASKINEAKDVLLG
jgi:hypothetical protein